MQVFGELQNATLENLASDPAASTQARTYFNTTTERIMFDDGTLKRALLRNDQKLIIGNSGTESENVRIHRGDVGVLQFLTGDDTTAEGSRSNSLQEVGFRLEGFTTAGRPANGNPGRAIYNTDTEIFEIDTGITWKQADSVSDGSITTVKLDDGAVTRPKMSPGAVAEYAVTTITALDTPYAVPDTHDVILVDITSDDVVLDLPAASATGRRYKIKVIGDSYYANQSFVDGDVDLGNDSINTVGHGFPNLLKVQAATDGTLPSGLSTLTNYWVIRVDDDNFKLAASLTDAIADTPIDLTALNAGNHSIEVQQTSCIIDGDAGETIDNALTRSLYLTNDWVDIASGGANWHIIADGPWGRSACVNKQEPAGTASDGVSTGATGDRREITDADENNLSVFLDATNGQFTLPPGTYEIDCSAATYRMRENRLYLYNATDSTIDLVGLYLFTLLPVGNVNTANEICYPNATMKGIITITERKVFEIRHRVSTSNVGGQALNWDGENEQYIHCMIRRLKVSE